MTRKYIMTLMVVFISHFAFSQVPTHRLRFKYRIKQTQLAHLNAHAIYLRTAPAVVGGIGASQGVCGTSVLKCAVTNVGGVLTIDPWQIKDYRMDPTITVTDPCFGDANHVNAMTTYPLTINISRGFSAATGSPVLVGYPTIKVTFHYQTWLIGVNTFGVKFRPRVTDYAGNTWSGNAITGSINAGVSLAYSFGWTTFTHRSSTSWSVSPAFSLGLASASLVKEPLKKQVLTTYNPSNFILSPSIGLILGRNDLGIFIGYGKDFMMGANSESWAYQGKRFLAIGLSASFKL